MIENLLITEIIKNYELEVGELDIIKYKQEVKDD